MTSPRARAFRKAPGFRVRLPQYLFFLGSIHDKLSSYLQEALDLEDALLCIQGVTGSFSIPAGR